MRHRPPGERFIRSKVACSERPSAQYWFSCEEGFQSSELVPGCKRLTGQLSIDFFKKVRPTPH